MKDPALFVAAFTVMETIINKALKYDPGTYHALQQLGLCRLKIIVDEPAFTFYVTNLNGEIKIQNTDEQHSDCQISGTFIDLVKLLSTGVNTTAGSGVNIQGDFRVLNQLSDITQQLEIDWEQAISDAFGTVMGSQVSSMIKKNIMHARATKEKAIHFTGDYLSEELRVTPSENELEYFYEDVDTLRTDVERLEAKMHALEQDLKRKKGPNA